MGDAGYGLVLIALGFILKRKMSKSMKGMMNLVITLGIFTSVIGAILGTFFGVSLFDLEIPAKLKEFMLSLIHIYRRTAIPGPDLQHRSP